MSKEEPTLDEYLRLHPYKGPMSTKPYAHPSVDGVTCYVKDVPMYEVDISPYITLHKSMETNEVVGVTIWGVREALADKAQ